MVVPESFPPGIVPELLGNDVMPFSPPEKFESQCHQEEFFNNWFHELKNAIVANYPEQQYSPTLVSEGGVFVVVGGVLG